MRVLVIEDDRETAAASCKALLRESGHTADLAGDGESGLRLAREGRYDVLIVDRMLPRRDGLSWCRRCAPRATARPCSSCPRSGEVDDRVNGLRAGGDDYLTKPYAYSELLARIEALARRAAPARSRRRVYRVGDLELDRLVPHGRRAPASRSCCSRASSGCSNT